MTQPSPRSPLVPFAFALVFLGGLATSTLADEVATPPVAKQAPHETEIHGETLVDPYYWLRERENPEVISYLEAENAYTEAQTAHTKALQKALYDEMLGRIQETDLSVPVQEDGYYYYTRTEEGKPYAIFCRKKGSLEAEEQVVLDANVLAEGHDYHQLGLYSPSPDHRLLAYSEDTNGSELYTLRIKDLETGELLPDTIPEIGYGFAWSKDGKTVFYGVMDEAKRPHKILRHVLGSDPADDEVVLHEEDERFRVYVDKTRSGDYILAGSGSAITTEIHFLDADTPSADFQVFLPRQQGVEYYLDHHGDHFYVRTNVEAKNFKLMRTPVDAVSPENWAEIISHRPRVKLEWVELFRNHMVVAEREAGLRRMEVRELSSGAERPIEMPETVYAVFSSSNPEFEATSFRFSYMSPITPRSVYEVDLETGAIELLKETPVPGYDRSLYETQRVYARARDGIAVPVILVAKKGLERNGENPTLLYGYGSYGSTLDPYFRSQIFSLLDRGFVFAQAQIRGGGELGAEWHDQGKMMQKRTTFTDFIDVAEYLVEQRITNSDRLVIQGGSAGGLLMGAVVNMRPDLFRAAVAQVPFVDVINTMLDESIPLTVGEFEEWGNPKNEEHFRYMISYSPYDNVTAQEYPNMLVTAGLHDPRVQYWEPAKWTAKLRATKSGDSLLLLKTNMEAGHGGASGRYKALEERAFVYAFMIDSVGIAD
ncbi:MAG: S9 family peptidase [Thermoanaerobaculia bacterium]|nr:S9 family peptidase [Thermoanaerobaculia bacterium]